MCKHMLSVLHTNKVFPFFFILSLILAHLFSFFPSLPATLLSGLSMAAFFNSSHTLATHLLQIVYDWMRIMLMFVCFLTEISFRN